ncbi:MAG: RagB/SusD family nutrient uptake outer membrane protein [Terrimonas sp.]|nr:RagB/SusD family nutrient uptake outer membrane protein [Terrimonas sp.]
MKINNKFRLAALGTALCCMIATGCKKNFLDEYNPSNQTTDNYYNTAKGIEDLVRSCYPLLRDITQQRTLAFPGTDVFAAADPGAIVFNVPGSVPSPYDAYDNTLNSSLGEIQTLFDLLYREINRCNTVVSRIDAVSDMSASAKTVRLHEAKFLRALCLFWAVQQWGDIPMPLDESTSASQEVTKTAAKDVYAQLITDLLACEGALPATASDYGRATKGAAQFLLARVYLTRGWNFNNSLGGTPADFTSALQYCDKIIASGLYPLQPNYKKLWPQHSENPTNQPWTAASSVANDKDPEFIFSVQYSSDVLTYVGDPSLGNQAAQGNNLHSVFGGDPGGCPGALTRTSDYNRFQAPQRVTPATYRLFDPQMDVRYDWDFLDAIVALKNVTNFKPLPSNPALTVNFAVGDTVVKYMPWNMPAVNPDEFGLDRVGGTKKYSVINTDQFGAVFPPGTPNPYNGSYPCLFKFWQPGIPYGDGFGTGNDPLFRSGEVYLMAAEAIVKGATGGQLGGADVYYNKVLDRALGANAGSSPQCAANPENLSDLTTVSYRATPGNITVDLIMDERARELLGEGVQRWYDLKRTGTLISRAKKYNPWTKFSNTITAQYLLRPLPQSLIDNSNPQVEQNPGY